MLAVQATAVAPVSLATAFLGCSCLLGGCGPTTILEDGLRLVPRQELLDVCSCLGQVLFGLAQHLNQQSFLRGQFVKLDYSCGQVALVSEEMRRLLSHCCRELLQAGL